MKYSIILVPFPFDDFSASKIRPALCLTNEIGNYQHIVIAFISSNITTDIIESDMLLEIVSKPETGLKVNSLIKFSKLVTIPKYLIKRKLGQLSLEDVILADKKLKILFELN